MSSLNKLNTVNAKTRAAAALLYQKRLSFDKSGFPTCKAQNVRGLNVTGRLSTNSNSDRDEVHGFKTISPKKTGFVMRRSFAKLVDDESKENDRTDSYSEPMDLELNNLFLDYMVDESPGKISINIQ